MGFRGVLNLQVPKTSFFGSWRWYFVDTIATGVKKSKAPFTLIRSPRSGTQVENRGEDSARTSDLSHSSGPTADFPWKERAYQCLYKRPLCHVTLLRFCDKEFIISLLTITRTYEFFPPEMSRKSKE